MFTHEIVIVFIFIFYALISLHYICKHTYECTGAYPAGEERTFKCVCELNHFQLTIILFFFFFCHNYCQCKLILRILPPAGRRLCIWINFRIHFHSFNDLPLNISYLSNLLFSFCFFLSFLFLYISFHFMRFCISIEICCLKWSS